MSVFGSDKPKEIAGEKISVVAELRAKSGHEDEMRSALEALVAPSQKEPGCIKYNVLRKQVLHRRLLHLRGVGVRSRP